MQCACLSAGEEEEEGATGLAYFYPAPDTVDKTGKPGEEQGKRHKLTSVRASSGKSFY